MVIRKNLTNGEIYNIANILLNANMDDVDLPVKVHFYFKKNMNIIVEMARDIDKSKIEIFSKYGTLDESKEHYNFDSSVIEQVNKDIEDLFSIEQEVKINTIPLEWLEGIELKSTQADALYYMIQEEAEE